MGLLDWLFPKTLRSDAEMRWSQSAAGNPTGAYKNRRLTIFAYDGGWKFCDAKTEPDDDPHYSDVYDSIEAAKYDAIARVGGQPSRFKSRSETAGDRRLEIALSSIRGKVALAAAIKHALGTDPKLAELRTLERKIASARRQLTSDFNAAYRAGDNEDTARNGERARTRVCQPLRRRRCADRGAVQELAPSRMRMASKIGQPWQT